MIAFPDTSFLCGLYRKQENSNKALRYVSGMQEALHVSSFLLFEFRQAARFQVFLRTQNKTLGYSEREALSMLAELDHNISTGFIFLSLVDWTDVAKVAGQMSAKKTMKFGCRSFDLLHVATALCLGAKEFLTFDQKQRQLAVSEGLLIPPELQ
jgi:predicted nucleic acid-binding protein